MQLNTILVGVDFSEPSELAAGTAIALARRFGARVELVHVYRPPARPLGLDGSREGVGGELDLRFEQHAEEDSVRFQDFREGFQEDDVPISTSRWSGHPAWGLVDAAADLAPDLVVLGSRGLSPIGRLLLGSVAERVTRHVDVPVLVVRDRGIPKTGFFKVLVATDFSDPAVRALDMGRVIAAPGTVVDLVNFWRIPGTRSWRQSDDAGGRIDADPLASTVHEQVEEAGVNWLNERSEGSHDVRFRLVNQEPIRGIRDWIERNGTDLVVVGDRGHEEDHEPTLGSVASSVLRRTDCSVLIAR